MRLVLLVLAVFFGSLCFGQVAQPVPAAQGGVISFIMAHSSVLSGVVVAVLDLIFALNPNANAPDGILHSVYLWLKGFSKPQA